MKVKDFIEQHKHINYCEAIIFPNGDIEYVSPSHIESLVKATNENRDYLDKKIPIDASVVAWLVDYTNCIALWYDFCYLPEQFTIQQTFTISELLKAKIIMNPYIGHQLKEKSIIERNILYRETGEFKEIEKKEIPFYL